MLMLDKFTEIAALIDALKCLHSTESGSRKDENGNSLAELVEPRKCCVMAWWFTVHLFLATHTHRNHNLVVFWKAVIVKEMKIFVLEYITHIPK